MRQTAEAYQAQVLMQVENGDLFEVLAKIKELYSMEVSIERAIKILNK